MAWVVRSVFWPAKSASTWVRTSPKASLKGVRVSMPMRERRALAWKSPSERAPLAPWDSGMEEPVVVSERFRGPKSPDMFSLAKP